jgi:hypothetical protein
MLLKLVAEGCFSAIAASFNPFSKAGCQPESSTVDQSILGQPPMMCRSEIICRDASRI